MNGNSLILWARSYGATSLLKGPSPLYSLSCINGRAYFSAIGKEAIILI